MSDLKKYTKRAQKYIVAVQLDLQTQGFTYHKWGGEQRCKRGDWLVNNGGDCYTVDHETFACTYTAVGAGTYAKTSAVWAEVTSKKGTLQTKEGLTQYNSGDYLVYNQPDRQDGYAVSKVAFEQMYESQVSSSAE